MSKAIKAGAVGKTTPKKKRKVRQKVKPARYIEVAEHDLLRDTALLMKYPLFSLGRGYETTPMIWENSARTERITVSADSLTGRATMYDKLVLIYCASLFTHQVRNGATIRDRTVEFKLSEYLRWAGKPRGGKDYLSAKNSIRRLCGTLIRTNIVTGTIQPSECEGADPVITWGENETPFPLISYKFKSPSDGKLLPDGLASDAVVEFTWSQWLYNAMSEFKEGHYSGVLEIAPGYLKLRSTLNRRLYELARKYTGAQKRSVEFFLDTLRKQCGSSESNPLNWKSTLREIQEGGGLLEYTFEIKEGRGGKDDKLYFLPKDAAGRQTNKIAASIQHLHRDTNV